VFLLCSLLTFLSSNGLLHWRFLTDWAVMKAPIFDILFGVATAFAGSYFFFAWFAKLAFAKRTAEHE
jgi:hypothetical protein